jgi:SAM-dependent methyltransferase
MNLRDILRKNPFLMRVYSMTRVLIGRANDKYYRINSESVDAFQFRSICEDATCYEAVPYWLLRRIVKAIRPGPEDVFFDIGCGKGRAIALFSRCQIKKCVGIEIDPELARFAVQNADTLRGRIAPIEVRVQNAIDSDYDSGTIYFLFNPFGAATLSAVLAKIQASLDKQPRKICVIYYNPLHLNLLQTVLGMRVLLRNEKHFPWRPQGVAIAFKVSRECAGNSEGRK